MLSGWTFCPMSGVLRRELDGQVAGALADARRAAHGPRAEALDRRTGVREHGVDLEILADQVVVVLRVRDRGLEQLAPGLGDGARVEGEDAAGLRDGLAADAVAHQARLARRGADVLGLGADDHALAGLVAA